MAHRLLEAKRMNQQQTLASIGRFSQAAGMVLFVAILYIARDVFIPMALGVLFAFVLSPVVDRLERLGLPNALAVIFTAAVVFSGISIFLFSVWTSLAGYTDDLPKYRQELRTKVESVQSLAKSLGGKIGQFSADDEPNADNEPAKLEGDESEGSDESTSVFGRWLGSDQKRVNDGSSSKNPIYVVEASTSSRVDLKTWAGGAAAVLGPIATTGLVTVFALFALLYRDDLRDRVVSVISKGNYVVTTEALSEASQRISKYLMAQLILNVSYGIVFALGLLLIGYFVAPSGTFPYVVLLGTIAGLVRFVPYVGPLIGAGVPLLVSLLLFPGYSVLGAVLVLIVAMELISNNVLEPWLYGMSTGVSPMAVIVSAVFWGWLWGPIGLLLATPLTVCAVVLGQYVPRFKFLAMLLSERINLKPSVRGYQRLLSSDQHKVDEFVAMEWKGKEIPGFIDLVLAPVVKKITSDHEKHDRSDEQFFESLAIAIRKAGVMPETLSADDDKGIAAAEAAEVKDVDALQSSSDASALPNPRHAIGIPVRHSGEVLTIQLLGHHLREFVNLQVFNNDDLPDRDAIRIVEQQPEIVIICVIPPGGVIQARFWCSALRRAGYRGIIAVACFGKFKNYDDLLVGFRKRGANWLATSAEQLCQKLGKQTPVRTNTGPQASSP